MTVRKHFKQLVRERMHKTGESYTTARRQIIGLAPMPPADPALRWHLPGNIPATTALRVLLAHAGVVDPQTKQPFSEAMVFGGAGGTGAGVCGQFHYAKDDISTFYIAGRHLWIDDAEYLKQAAKRLGVTTTVKETSGGKTAEKQLRDQLEAGPCIAWVDMIHLPHRALPQMWSGGGYHVVTVYKIDGDQAWIGDLTDEPVKISLDDLAVARARIKKQKHRLLALSAAKNKPDVGGLVRGGLAACVQGMMGQPMKNYPNMFNLNAFDKWAERLVGDGDQSWERIFPRGANLWRALTGMHRYIEHYGTGGGLCRPIFGEFLTEAGAAIKDARLRALAEQYAEIGRDWTALAEAALPNDVPLFKQARACHDRYAELFTSGGSIDDKQAVWAELKQLATRVKDDFPLSEEECTELRRHLQQRVLALVVKERSAFAALGDAVAAMG